MKFNIFRLTLAILISHILISCGGGSDPLSVANVGINGTGITMGRITNFGSIFVNGVRFDVNNATFLRDGNTSTGQSEFSVGEYVTLKGNIDPNGTSGTASEVSFTNILEGSLTAETTDNLSIEVLGQTVNADPLTVFINFKKLSDLAIGNILEVSGIKDADGVITATSIKLKKTSFIDGDSENEIAGTISNVNPTAQTFNIGNLTIEYSNALLEDFNGETPKEGQFIVAKSTSDVLGTVLVASRIALGKAVQPLPTNTNAVIEGQVTRFVSPRDFDVNGLLSTTTDSTQYQSGGELDISLNSIVEIEGTVNNAGVLIAQTVSFKDATSIIEVTGLIQSINLMTKEIVLDNQTVVIDTSTLIVTQNTLASIPMPLNDLLVGDTIEIRGSILPNGKILSIKLTLEQKDAANNTFEDLNTSETLGENTSNVLGSSSNENSTGESSIPINESMSGENNTPNTENIPNGNNISNEGSNQNGNIEPNSNTPKLSNVNNALNGDASPNIDDVLSGNNTPPVGNVPDINNTQNGNNTPTGESIPSIANTQDGDSTPAGDSIPSLDSTQVGDNTPAGESIPSLDNTQNGGNTSTGDSIPSLDSTQDGDNTPTGESIPSLDNTQNGSNTPPGDSNLTSNNGSNGNSLSNEINTSSEENTQLNGSNDSNGNSLLSGSITQENNNDTNITNQTPSGSGASFGNGGGNFGASSGRFNRN